VLSSKPSLRWPHWTRYCN